MKSILHKNLNEILKKENIAGMCVAVTDREKIIFKEGFGVETSERPEIPTHADALYRVASVTKMISGLCIMKLCEDGILDLDTPVCEYIPWISLEKNAETKINLRMLLSHTSGLPQEYTPDGPREESALEDSLKKELACAKLCSDPKDGKYLYSNLGIRLASYIAELKTGKPFSHIAKEYVLSPLGMNVSTFDLRDAATYPLSLPHDDINGKLIPQHHIKENAARLAAGGLYSNTYELCKFARCLLNKGKSDLGKEIISEKSLNEMFKEYSNARNDGVDSYGLTMMINHYKGSLLYGHLGDASPYGASVFCDVKKGYGVVTLMNTFRSEQRTKIPQMIFDILSQQ